VVSDTPDRHILNINGVEYEIAPEVGMAFEQLMAERNAAFAIIQGAIVAGLIAPPDELDIEQQRAGMH
jgi:hypothetical protein